MMFNARIEWDTRDDTPADTLMDTLADVHPSVHTGPYGHLGATISLPAETLRQAATITLAVAETAMPGTPVLTLQVMPTQEHDRRAGLPVIPDMLSVTEAATALGITRQAVLQRLTAGTLAGTRVGSAWAIPASSVTQP